MLPFQPINLYWRLTLHNQILTTALFTPFIGYFFLLIGGLTEPQMLDFIFCIAYAATQDFVIHAGGRRLRLLPILRGIYETQDSEKLRPLKIRLLQYSFSEGWISIIRWFTAMLTLYFIFVTRHNVSQVFIVNLFLLPTMGSVIAWYASTTLAESTLATLQKDSKLSSILLAPDEYRSLSFSARFLLGLLGVAILTIYFFSYILHEPIANKIFMAHPLLHSLGSVGVMLGFALYTTYISHAAFKPALQESIDAITTITHGNLSINIPQFGAHDISNIGYLINRQAEQLREIVGRVRTEAQALSQGATELESEAQNLAQDASEQSNSIQAVSTHVRQIATASHDAKDSMIETVQAIEVGFDAISTVSERMVEIDKQTSEIENSVGVIDGISRQVTLLALNATIEAARAGTEGRSFSVVADEISKLSEQTKENSKRIRESIVAATLRSSKGKTAAHAASAQFEKISESSGLNASQIEKIVDASGGELSQNMARITGVTDKVVASSRNVAILANSFKEKSVTLEEIIRYFA